MKSEEGEEEETHDVEVLAFEVPRGAKLFLPEIRWPEDDATALASDLKERLSRYGLIHSVYASKCTRRRNGNLKLLPVKAKLIVIYLLQTTTRAGTSPTSISTPAGLAATPSTSPTAIWSSTATPARC